MRIYRILKIALSGKYALLKCVHYRIAIIKLYNKVIDKINIEKNGNLSAADFDIITRYIQLGIITDGLRPPYLIENKTNAELRCFPSHVVISGSWDDLHIHPNDESIHSLYGFKPDTKIIKHTNNS